jgi:hypothetical protein
MSDDVVKRVEFDNHLKDDFRKVHNIWPNLTYGIPHWTGNLATITINGDSNWHDVTVSGAATGADKTIMVMLMVNYIYESGQVLNFRTRKNGSSANEEGYCKWSQQGAGMILQECANAVYEYQSTKSTGTYLDVKQIGYFTFPV